ncbi:MAG: hypothetical protein IT285_03680 [Bdellovibrionales bacterium]|nr:hypothetical protein [Bdellovibrionales bacterium]
MLSPLGAWGASAGAPSAPSATAIPPVAGVRMDQQALDLSRRWMIFYLGLRVGSDAQYERATRCLVYRAALRSPGPPGRVAVLRASNFRYRKPEEQEASWGLNPIESFAEAIDDAIDDHDEYWRVDRGTALYLAVVPGNEADDLMKADADPDTGLLPIEGPWRSENVQAYFRSGFWIPDTITARDPGSGKTSTGYVHSTPERVAFPQLLVKFLGSTIALDIAECALEAGLLAPPEAFPETQGRAPGGETSSGTTTGPCRSQRP